MQEELPTFMQHNGDVEKNEQNGLFHVTLDDKHGMFGNMPCLLAYRKQGYVLLLERGVRWNKNPKSLGAHSL